MNMNHDLKHLYDPVDIVVLSSDTYTLDTIEYFEVVYKIVGNITLMHMVSWWPLLYTAFCLVTLMPYYRTVMLTPSTKIDDVIYGRLRAVLSQPVV